MKILEYGNNQKQKIILIHGFQSPYQIWEDYIKYYQDNYHIIVPVLPCHNQEHEENFISFDEIASKIEEYYLSRYGSDVYAIFGMSLGGIIASIIWKNQKLNINKIIFDGTPLVPYPKILKSYLTNFYLKVTRKTRVRDPKTINQAKNNIIPEKYLNPFLKVLDNMSDDNIVDYLNGWGEFKLPDNINLLNTKIYYFHGTKLNEMIAKKSAKFLKKHYANLTIIKFIKKGHCEVSLMDTKKMIQELDKILKI